MRVAVLQIDIPSGYALGQPASTRAELLHVYGTGATVAYTAGGRAIVFDGAEHALRMLGATADALRTWPAREVDATVRPCLTCRRIFALEDEHRCEPARRRLEIGRLLR
jgi:hypothetical protein